MFLSSTFSLNFHNSKQNEVLANRNGKKQTRNVCVHASLRTDQQGVAERDGHSRQTVLLVYMVFLHRSVSPFRSARNCRFFYWSIYTIAQLKEKVIVVRQLANCAPVQRPKFYDIKYFSFVNFIFDTAQRPLMSGIFLRSNAPSCSKTVGRDRELFPRGFHINLGVVVILLC